MIPRRAVGTALLAAGLCLAMPVPAEAPATKEKKVTTSPLYAARFAGPRRDSAIVGETRAEGVVEWSRDIGLPAGSAPRDVLSWQGGIAVVGGGRVVQYSTNGERLWDRPASQGAPVVAANGLLYLVSRNTELEAVDATNIARLKEAPIPGQASRKFQLELLWPRQDDFVTTSYMADPTYDSEDLSRPQPKPLTVGRRTVYGEAIGAWGVSHDGHQRLPPLLLPGPGLWVIALDQVVVVNLSTEEERPHFKLSLSELTEWSADSSGTLYVTGYAGGNKALLAVTTAGREMWRWIDKDEPDRWAASQPPMLGLQGRAFLLTEGRVLAIDAGKLTWSYDARSESLRHGALAAEGSFEVKDGRLLSTAKLRYGTSLSDGSILVVGSKTLRRIDASGRKVFALTLATDIVTPPVVDADGNVYVATASQLIKIR